MNDILPHHKLVEIYTLEKKQINLELGNSAVTHFLSIEKDDLRDDMYVEALEFSFASIGYMILQPKPEIAAFLDRKRLNRVAPTADSLGGFLKWRDEFDKQELTEVLHNISGYEVNKITYFSCEQFSN